MKRILAASVAAVLAIGTLAGCGSKATNDASGAGSADGDVIKIGIFEPLTGANAAGGQLEVEGMVLANEMRPEVLGKKVVLVQADNKSDKAEATTAAARLIEKEKVACILGSWGSSLSIAAGDLVKTNKVPAIGASCTNPLVTQGNDYYFRVCFIDTDQGRIVANYCTDNFGAKKVAVIQEVSNDYSTGLVKIFSENFKAQGGEIIDGGSYQTNDTDFSGILANLKSSNPDAIFAPGNYTESAMIIKQARAQGITAPFIGCDTWETGPFIEVGGSDVEGAIMTTFFDDKNPVNDEGKKFVEAYNKKYPDKQGNIDSVAALGYDAYMLALDAIERAGSTDGTAVRDAIAATKDFQGATGAITINETGDADKDVAIIKTVKDGKFTFLDTVKMK